MNDEQMRKANVVRLDLDTWLSLNAGDMPRENVIEIHQRLLDAIRPRAQMVDIKAGSQLDRAISEAIGLKVVYKVLGGPEFFVDHRQGTAAVPREFHPSTNLNDAFYAAEEVGLFTVERDGPEVHLAKAIDGEWEVLTGGSAMGYITRESTPELAICAAILSMKES